MVDYPHYSQADPRWGQVILGRNKTIKQAGCAITAMAMAISGDSGKEITPKMLDHYLDKNGGYLGDSIIWERALEAANYFGAYYISWAHLTPAYQLCSNEDRIVIVRVDTPRFTKHYLLMLPDGSFHDPASSQGANCTLEEKGYRIDRYTVFVKGVKK